MNVGYEKYDFHTFTNGIAIIPTSISNNNHYKVWDEITHPKTLMCSRWSLGMDR